ncbi:hypothetical protein Trydic_g23911 [Trypoxylus dichotomus]
MGQPTDKWDTSMICALTPKLDQVSKREWEQLIAEYDIESITVKKLTDFLARRCQLLETIDNKIKVFTKSIACETQEKIGTHINNEIDAVASVVSTSTNEPNLRKQVVLPTVILQIRDSYGKWVHCRALLDSGSQANFMTATLLEKLQLRTIDINIPIAGINTTKNTITRKRETVICSLDYKYKTKDVFLILDEITDNLPQLAFDLSNSDLPQHIVLADKQFNVPKPIELLLGASIFFDALLTGQIKLDKNKPIIQETVWMDSNWNCERCEQTNIKKNEELKHFRLDTITYGTASSSNLACRVLYQVAIENENEFPEASNVIKNDFYMDDLLSGAEHVQDAPRLKDEISSILRSAGLNLRKWCSNSREFIENNNLESLPQHYIVKNENIKGLGLIWDPNDDVYSFKVDLVECQFVTKLKLFLQRLWQTQTSWDEVIPLELHSLWKQFYKSMENLNDMKIPRKVLTSGAVDFELHAFGDASESAFGSCVYIRSVTSEGLYSSRLLWCADYIGRYGSGDILNSLGVTTKNNS